MIGATWWKARMGRAVASAPREGEPWFFEDSALALAAALREGRTTSRALVEASIDRARIVNPELNAIVAERYERALAEADAADALLAEARREGDPSALPPLLGVPCSIKEAFALEGMPNTSGLLSRRGLLSEGDATAVARLREAGAIPLGVTNVSELCMWMESANHVYGRTSNPWDLGRTVGGSSGGEGAVVGAGIVPFGLGSDIGGSIRMPSFFNGIYGHKPSGGLVPGTGQFPLAEGQALRYLTTGPMCRRAEDLMPLLRILAGPDGQDGGCEAVDLGDPAKVSVEGLQVTLIEWDGRIRVAPELRKAMHRAGLALQAAGAHVRFAEVPELRHSVEIWGNMLSAAGGTPFRELLEAGEPIVAPVELMRWAMRRSKHTLPALALAFLEELPGLGGDGDPRFLTMGQTLRARLEDLAGDGVLLYPSHARTAPRHGAALLVPWRWAYTAILNVMELPATQIPLGLDERGLPLGVQAVAGWGKDHVSIAVAEHLAGMMPSWQPPWTVVTER